MPDFLHLYFTVLAAVFGLLIGSFLNVVIYRVPAGETLMGRSHCPRCNNQIRARDNVPVFSWLILRARCRDCSQPISIRYPLIEAGHAIAWTLLVWFYGPINPGMTLLLMFFASISIALAMIDFDTMRLPNVIVYPTTLITAAALTALAISENAYDQLARAGIAAAVLVAFYLLLHIATRGRGLGMGDVKLAATLGMLLGWFGWGALAVGTLSAFVVGGIPAGILMAVGVIKRGTRIPFGPMLLAGAWIGILWGQQLTDWYLGIYF